MPPVAGTKAVIVLQFMAAEFGCGCVEMVIVGAGCDSIVKTVVGLGNATIHLATLTTLPPPQALTTTATR